MNSVTVREVASIEEATQHWENQMLRSAAREAPFQEQATHYQNYEATEAIYGRMKQATQKSMDKANAAMNARSTAASDTEDHSLDQQTVQGSNGWGGTAQSNDPNANPNGMVKGNWTLDKKVHGKGQPW